MTNIKLISVTPNAEETVGYCARVSNPANQSNPDVSGLLSFCIRHGHWSIFEMANMVVEIETTRGIAAQILRHRSFSFQEFSQRYAEAEGFKEIEPRRQDKKNRQNSLDDLDKHDREWFKNSLVEQNRRSLSQYKEALKRGVAKESARFFLPLNTTERLEAGFTTFSCEQTHQHRRNIVTLLTISKNCLLTSFLLLLRL